MPNNGLKPDTHNIRKHSDRNKAAIRKSLETIGAGRSILVDAEDNIIAGNGVYEQAQALGLKVQVIESEPDTLIAVKRSDLTGEKARQAAALDNIVADTSAYDYERQLLRTLANEDAIVKQMIEQDARLIALMGDTVENPLDEWQGMPEFHQEDKTAFKSIIVHFDSPENVKNFAELVGQTITDKTKFIWYPKKEREDLKALAYSES